MNNIDPKDYCFDGSTVNFETNKNKFSEWYIEGMVRLLILLMKLLEIILTYIFRRVEAYYNQTYYY